MKNDTTKLIGTILHSPQGRDAIHIAVASVIANQTLAPSQAIGFLSPGNTELVGKTADTIGIVDPFLKDAALKGERFFMFLYPGTISSLRHEWTHPAFEGAAPDKPESEKWLREYAVRLKPYEESEEAYASLLSELRNGEISGHGKDLDSFSDLKDPETLREHAERLLGIQIDWANFSFTCSC